MTTGRILHTVTRSVFSLALTFTLVTGPNIQAYSHGSGGGEGSGETTTVRKSSRAAPKTKRTAPKRTSQTNAVVSRLNSAVSQCRSLPKEYRADCLAQFLNDAAKAATGSEYKTISRTLKSASSKISQIVRKNEDKSAPKIRRNGKTYRAVKKTALAKVNSQAKKVIAETSTKLLRSAGNSSLKKVHFTKIAKAVNSTKVLLRS